MDSASPHPPHVFSPVADKLLKVFGGVLVVGVLYVVATGYLIFDPHTTDVGYAPVQPIPYSHRVHVGQMGMDCRYCHNTVDEAAFAAVPPAQTCYNCHSAPNPETGVKGVRWDSPQLVVLHEAVAEQRGIPWIKVHDLPDYVYFNHAAHVNRGVGCYECHGRVDQMEVVYQAQPLSMSWCLECHRQPENYLRPREEVTNMLYREPSYPAAVPLGSPEQLELGLKLKDLYKIRDHRYLTDCSTCHR